MSELRKIIVFLVVTLIFIYMIKINFSLLTKYGHKKRLSALLILGLGLISAGTFFDVIAFLIDIRLNDIISICFTAGAIIFGTYIILWSRYIINIITKLHKKAHNDSMTGVYNRVGFELIFREKSMEDNSFYIMVFDLDKTKRINDTLGHSKGDEYIINAANIINEEIGINGFVGRTGGDEFVAFVKNIGEEGINEIKELIKKRVANIKNMEGTQISIGYSFGEREGNNLKELLEVADKRMYMDKNNRILR